jgi:nitroimidazol reductase NimA-like FMN-containing flavoprotein (pyridoxamine 5'-phosphate oxidase superfamily)
MSDDTTPELDPRARAILAEARYARVGTVSEGGAPNVAPFWFHHDGERVVLFTGENKTVRNLRRDPRVSVIVDLGARFDEIRAVQLEGRASAYPYDNAPAAVLDAVAGLQEKYAEELDSPLYREFQGDGPPATVYVAIAPTRVRWWDFGARIA